MATGTPAPATTRALVVGVYDEDLVPVLARTLARMDAERALVVHGSGLDEIAVHGETTVAEVDGDDVEEYTLTPESLGVGRHEVSSIAGGQPEENAADLEGVVTGEVNGAKRDIILANAGAGIYIAGEASSIEDGVEQARRTIDSGDAAAKMEELRAVGRLGATASD